jgi:hypothetical protein
MSRCPASSSGLLTLQDGVCPASRSPFAAGTAVGLTWFFRRNAAEAALAVLATLAGGVKFFDWLAS